MAVNYLSVTELLAKYRTGELSPVDVLDAYEAQYQRLNPALNAFSFSFFERARDEAKIAQRAYKNGNVKALTGLFAAIKDETNVAGEPMTNGSVCLAKHIATTTDPVPEALLGAGATILGRTTTPEFSTNSVTWSDLWGVSRNPWNPDITCGGSSGGSAIAVATGMCSFANGTDIGGSIRIPAAMCGVFGYKPPHGRVADISPYNIDAYCHHGLITRTLDDMLLLYPYIRGAHWADYHSFIPSGASDLKPTKSVKELKIAISIDLGFYQVEEDIQRNLLVTAQQLKDMGAQVELVDLDWDERVIQTAKVHQRALMGQMLQRDFSSPEQFSQLTSYVKNYLSHVAQTTLQDVFEANLHMCEMWDKLATVFKQYDLVVCPTVATTRIAADFDYSKDCIEINGVEVDANKGWFMTYPFNTLGQCPVLSMPNGFCDNGVPSSIQIVGRPYQEQHIFEVAKALEKMPDFAFYRTVFPDVKGN
jgi:Asp-tRNA(Asn)/Glu-tRNA(Gln) amidotransferase A subunit family amidase